MLVRVFGCLFGCESVWLIARVVCCLFVLCCVVCYAVCVCLFTCVLRVGVFACVFI